MLDLVLDEFAPLKDEAEPQTDVQSAPQPTCKFVLSDGTTCGTVEDNVMHGHGPSQHKFQLRKSRTKKALPASVSQRVKEDVKKAIKPGDCVQCPNPADANIHHLVSTPGFHKFKRRRRKGRYG